MSEIVIEWKYFFGGSCGKNFDRYYYAFIDGIRVEKHSNRKGSTYSIGNIDNSKNRFTTENELIKFLHDEKHNNKSF